MHIQQNIEYKYRLMNQTHNHFYMKCIFQLMLYKQYKKLYQKIHNLLLFLLMNKSLIHMRYKLY